MMEEERRGRAWVLMTGSPVEDEVEAREPEDEELEERRCWEDTVLRATRGNRGKERPCIPLFC